MLIKNINLIPMTEEKVITNQAVRVEGKIVHELLPAHKIADIQGEEVIDGQGAYLLPGLADMHMHTRPDWIGDTYPISPFYLYLANGVTTIRDFGPVADDPTYVLKWRDEIKQGLREGPYIYTSGTPLFGPVEDPAGMIRTQKAQGFEFAKLYSFLSRDEFNEAMATAKEVGMYTAGHIPFSVGLEGVIAAGMDEIAHVEELDFEFIEFDKNSQLGDDEWFAYLMEQVVVQFEMFQGLDLDKIMAKIEPVLPKVVDLIRSANLPVCTTMVVGNTVYQKLFNPELFLYRPENKYLKRGYLDAFRRGEDKHQVQFKGNENLAIFKYEIEKKLLSTLHHGGVRLLLSSDAGAGALGLAPGYSIHRELQILVENGFTPYEAIATGTVNAAEVVHKITGDGNFGKIEAGKRADLVLVKANPLENVAHLKEPVGVMAAGRWYPRDMLNQMTAVNGRPG